MVYRVYVEKKSELANEAKALLNDAKTLLGICALENVRVINRYDAENITPELFDYAKKTVFSEPQLDIVTDELEANGTVFAVEYLPGQFDQRADSCEQCIQLLTQGERCKVKNARVYIIDGDVSDAEFDKLKAYLINPVESCEASLEKVDTLKTVYNIPTEVAVLDGFISLDEEGLKNFIADYGLAMDLDDIKFCQKYFSETEKREPTDRKSVV